ncbi:MAG: aminotransferase class III-fold pyridoxal phosphate-dependent enzyme, partial [Planctomycetes bacterium]|nr:aminotransferase class III-fold pyridoxal phosphate-dependent enzyme [Planctomycetota bacterium]
YDRGIGAPTIDAIKEEVEKIPDKQRVIGWKLSAMRALDSLAFSKVAGTTRSTQEEHTKALLESQTIIELDALADSMKQFLVPILSLWLYSVRLASPDREKLCLVIVVEEAHNVLYRGEHRSKETVMNRLLRQCREIGIGIIVVDQSPHLISSVALGNTYTSICLNLKDPSDINRAAALSHLTEYEKGHMTLLSLGVGIIKLQGRWKRPILVRVPLVDVAKGAVTDELLKRYIDGSGGPAVYCLGHANKEVNDAIKAQLDRIAHGYRGNFTSDPLEELQSVIAECCGRGFNNMLFVTGGSEAVESCLKLALQYQQAIGENKRVRFIARHRSWHGNTLGALAVSGFSQRRDLYEGALMPASFVSAANAYRPPDGVAPEQLVAYLAAELDREIDAAGAQNVCAFIFEPVVGAAAGAVPAPPGYASAIREVCDHHGVLVIAASSSSGRKPIGPCPLL